MDRNEALKVFLSSMLLMIEASETYEEREVDRYEDGDLFIDTCAVPDAAQPYETAVEHPRYNNGEMVIVEMYDTKKEAQKGHDRWVAKMTRGELPTALIDVSSCGLANLVDAFAQDDAWRVKEYQDEAD